jgi:hypothetical protein
MLTYADVCACAGVDSLTQKYLGKAEQMALTPPDDARYSVYLLYWYQSTHTDADEALLASRRSTSGSWASRFLRKTCQTSSTRTARYSVYLLYWYKSTNTDAEGAASSRASRSCRSPTARSSRLPLARRRRRYAALC